MPSEGFHRIRRLPLCVFAEVNTAKARACTAGEDIIDLGMGNPDSPTPPHIVAKLAENTQRLRQAMRSIRAFLTTGSNQAEPVSTDAVA